MKTDQLAPGTVLGRYELLLPIASGGMATVWVARSRGSRGFSKTVAVKTILPNLSDDPTFEQMFLDEAAIASKIQHPNVAQIIDLGEEDELLYLAMEWVDGESLSTLSKFAKKSGNEIPVRVALKIISQACAGIHAAHELRDDDDKLLELVHRDISPQNILITSGGVVKIVDFGVAKALGRSGETSAGQLKGKVPFMSPEQAKGGKVDRRTDIFALGIILYRMTTLTHPFLDENDIKTMRNIISRPVMPPRVKAPNMPVELERCILKALQKDPDKRQSTAAELEQELEQIMTQHYGGVPVDEVATFVRATLGERDRKRRAAIRDAALKMDDAAPSRLSNPSLPVPPPTDSMSGIMLTQTHTPASALTGADIVSVKSAPKVLITNAPDAGDDQADEVTRAIELRPDGSLVSAGMSSLDSTPTRDLKSDPLIASSPTLAALAAPGPASTQVAPKKSKSFVVAAALGCAIGLGALLAVKLGSSDRPGGGVSTASPAKPGATTTAQSRAADATSQPSIDVHDLPDSDLPPGGDATQSPSAEASSDPAVATKPAVGPRGLPPRPTTASAKTTATAATPPPPTTTGGTTPTPKPNVPAVQDPGF